MEGLQAEAEEFGTFLANEGAEQCGFCNPGFIMNVLAMTKELEDPTEEEMKEYLAGNLCRCSGFVGQTRSILKYLEYKKAQKKEECRSMSYVNQSLQKKDAMALVTGKPVYTDDLAPKDCLIIKILRSPYANAWVEEIKTGTATKGRTELPASLPGKTFPRSVLLSAGQTYPEFSPVRSV
ncbi:MAG: 2Fe-2S iron-sulfur cluster-binding protein [Ruminococcus sp.]